MSDRYSQLVNYQVKVRRVMKSHQLVAVKGLLIFVCFMIGEIFASPNSSVDEIKLPAIRGEPGAQLSLGLLYHSGQEIRWDII